ncbi:TPA: DEAD/DEAH box helicase [Vibrio vulnificus]|nr:DEAD/DEAH box helicase [Vibrio vulnificus]HAS6164776.1 DEAD/DEAH box helicase [Vibrio vulnificus]HAS6323619.1 DEAD/DEAH box helicase [Vibrio vulnificus]HAU8258981.1 DEAD/DEAH box helicase [Vibrio vulnificus]HDY7550899.1 DEAD/DEAH box helicase [Vibrio vulnificus]
MRFESKSSKLLSITKSKAKMYEFGLDEEHHIDLTESPTKLLLMTIGILGDLCREELSSEKDAAIYEQRKAELRNVARYFDALIGSKLQTEYDYYLSLLGAASYYLADMPGSAIVLSDKLDELKVELTESGVETLLEWLLKAKFDEPLRFIKETPLTPAMLELEESIRAYFDTDLDASNNVLEASRSVRKYCHDMGCDRELLLADIIASVVVRKIKNSSLNLLPTYTGLPLEEWLPALANTTFIKEFWPAQRLLGDAGVFSGRSAVVQLPTSAGKTKSAELIIRSSFLSGRASVAVIIAPFRSLCREISTSLSVAFANEDVLVNQLNDVPQIDDFDVELFLQLLEQEEDNSTTPTIIVATPEKLVYLLRHKPELSETISLVIYDEGHQFDTGSRGVTYELLLTSLKRELREDTQHVLISAVLSNAQTIGDWLYAGNGTVVNGSEYLSTERSIAFASWKSGRGQFHYVEPFNIDAEEFFVPRVMESLEIPRKGNETVKRLFPPRDDKSLVAAYLGLKLSESGPVAVFCGQKSSVLKICREIVKPLDRIEQLEAPIAYSNQDEIKKIGRLSELHLGSNSVVTKAIKRGVLPHSASIPNGLRISVEHAMEAGLGRCVVCTSTLAQGVNLPIKYLVVSGVFQGEKLISTRDFHNLLGRAGRAGKHTEGSIIFADTELFDRRLSTKRWQWSQMNNLLDPSNSESCLSSLLSLVQPLSDENYSIDPIAYLELPYGYEERYLELAREGENVAGLLKQMQQRIRYLESLESFLLANLSSDEMLDGEALTELYNGTLAFSLASDKEKEKLAQAFRIVADRVKQVEPAKRPYYGKALLGIQKLDYLEQWFSVNIGALDEEPDILGALEFLWPVLEHIGMDNSLGKLIGEGAGLSIAKQWCSGVSYNEILLQANRDGFKYRAGSQQRNLKIENISDICDNSLGYEAMLIVGACADLLENLLGNPPLTEPVRQLQMSLRIGLSDSLATELYALGLADRVVAADISAILTDSGENLTGHTKEVVIAHRQIIEQQLRKHPSVFFEALYGSA